MTTVIASRELPRIRPDGVREKFVVEIGLPAHASAGMPGASRDWYYCPVRLVGHEREPTIHSYYGQDSLRALQSAITGVGTLIAALPFADEFVASALPNFGFAVDATGWPKMVLC